MNICEDILFNILLLLSPRILHRRMRYVSKQWFRIITDALFVDAHLNRSQPGLLLQTISDDDYRPNRPLARVDNDQQVVQEQVNTTVKVLGSCNGLLLLVKTARKKTKKARNKFTCSVTIYNPVTGQTSILPVFSRENPLYVYGGLGFDPSTQEYRVVVIFLVEVGTAWNCKILTFGNGWRRRWSRVHDVSSWHDYVAMSYINPVPVLVDCSLNWVRQDRVISMDVSARSDEKFQRIDFHQEMKGCFTSYYLTDVGGKLGVSMLLPDNSEIVIWTMDDYKIWRKQFRIPYLRERIDTDGWHSYPVCLTGMGSIRGEDVMLFVKLNRGRTSYFTYSLKECTVTHLIDFLSYGKLFMNNLHYIHVDSLVSW